MLFHSVYFPLKVLVIPYVLVINFCRILRSMQMHFYWALVRKSR